MARQVIIRSKDQYWHDYILEGITKKLPHERIKQNLLDAFQKEMFGQLVIHCNVGDVADVPDLSKRTIFATNLFKQTKNKWDSLCKMCSQYVETMHLITPSDIEEILNVEDRAENTHNNEENRKGS